MNGGMLLKVATNTTVYICSSVPN
ncbi:hypothetical protein APK127v_20 [Acinetobacter phage APK127v]|uniref:Uncharacterized protein n=1 Tax=Acinetobacter phage APK127v TaxID=2936913 RepID=A0A9E7S4G4_9CAUD|nr:hypothetical protein APK127v_20 [Acinetobacter phage APK127v]